ncbi:integration host factor subunit beta [candidate division WOR-3 bacterium]|nr:integration host factor subunit beta [candidate division WOR-3 bacterium]
MTKTKQELTELFKLLNVGQRKKITKTKQELVREVAKNTGFTQRETSIIINSFLDAVSETLSSNNRIELRRFGVFATKRRNSKQARNPKTGEIINLPQRTVPVFKASKILKEKVKRK